MEENYDEHQALHLLVSQRLRKSENISNTAFSRLESATRYGHYKFLLDRHGRRAGYIAWARLNKEAFCLFRRDGKLPQSTWEWDEGYLFVIADCSWQGRAGPHLRRQLRAALCGARLVAYQRNGILKTWVRKNGRYMLVDRREYPE